MAYLWRCFLALVGCVLDGVFEVLGFVEPRLAPFSGVPASGDYIFTSPLEFAGLWGYFGSLVMLEFLVKFGRQYCLLVSLT